MVETILKFVVAPAAVVVQFLVQRGGVVARIRSRLRVGIELRDQLPKKSEARATLEDHIDNLVFYYISAEIQQLQKVRDWNQVAVNVVMIGGFGYLTWYLVSRHTVWGWVLGAVVGILVAGLVGTTITELRGKAPQTSMELPPEHGEHGGDGESEAK